MADREAAQRHIEQAAACLEDNRPEDALPHIENALAPTESAHAWYVKGSIHTQLGDDREAAKRHRTHPARARNAPSVGNLGCVLQRLNARDEASSASDTGGRNEPSRTRGSTRAVARRPGKHKEAIMLRRRAEVRTRRSGRVVESRE